MPVIIGFSNPSSPNDLQMDVCLCTCECAQTLMATNRICEHIFVIILYIQFLY